MTEQNFQAYTKEKKSKKSNIWKRFKKWLSKSWRKLHPRPRVRKGAAIGLIVLVVCITIVSGVFIRPGLPGILDSLGGVVILAVLVVLFGLLAALVLKVLTILPRFVTFLGLVALISYIFFLGQIPFSRVLLFGIIVGLAEALLGASLAHFFKKKFGRESRLKKIYVLVTILLTVALNAYLIHWFASRGTSEHLVERKVALVAVPPLEMSDPSMPGRYDVQFMTYGSGTDKRRPEFSEEAALKTEPVDATPFVKENKGWRMKFREWFWGFDFKEFPINGRVWYPDGQGPFPLVLCVHGNHLMGEFSDPGYAYLGELLASRGFIFVSVDENFFNGHWIGSLKSENDGRGWMLLQHLKVWREWNQAEGHAFFGKVDTNNIGIIGHSRGGEAAAIAGSFNRLSHYPDDATIEFEFNFNIKAIVSIAPSDGQYKPAGRPTPLENVNYLTLQGAHDADVSSFSGVRQYNRVKFTDGQYWFKAYIYSYRSNHGQFNTVWGDNDWGKPWGVILNRKPLLSGEEQRKIGSIYITAFLEIALHGKTGYIPLFRDYRGILDWLPDDIFVNRFEDSAFRALSDYDEDVDVTTMTLEGGTIEGVNLAVWREADLSFRRWGTQDNNVAYIGWRHPDLEEADYEESRGEEEGSYYSLKLPENGPTDFNLTPDTLLVFSLADADEKPPEPEEEDEDKAEEKKEEESEDEEKGQEEERQRKEENMKKEEEEEKEPTDFSVELVDSEGQLARLPLSRFRTVPPVLKAKYTKFRKENNIYGKAYEPTLQVFELPLSVFSEEFPEFNVFRLHEIRFVFDLCPEGVVILDRVGFAEPFTLER
jgi:dienelactone hydrolase